MALCFVTAACGGDTTPPDTSSIGLERAFRSADLPGCAWASPLLFIHEQREHVLVATTAGHVAAFDAASGDVSWTLDLPAPAGQEVWLAATPALVGQRAVVAWQNRTPGTENRRSHQAAVIDLDAGALDPQFPLLTLEASVPANDGSGNVPFLASNSFSRSTIAHARTAASTHGHAYISFGNLRDIQPWHGWVFELDLDAWAAGGTAAAISSVLLTTPETDCGTPGDSGADDMICGGGVWAPSGLLVTPTQDSFELVIPTGNGQLDLTRQDYANTLMRVVGPGLAFDPRCDPAACADFDPIDPAPACMASCRDLFIPRLMPGDPPLSIPDGRCDGKTFLECYALADLDLGANTPARVAVPGRGDVLVLPAKDGHVYLMDAANMGVLYDRLRIAETCGANGGQCTANWAGMMVAEPVVTTIAGDPAVLIPTFVFDRTNPAGMVALAIVADTATGEPRFELRWQAPQPNTSEAVERFREHTGRIALVQHAGIEYAVLADPGPYGSASGILYLVRVEDGAIVERARLGGAGHKYIEPAVSGSRLFVSSCDAGEGPGQLEAWDVLDKTAP